ncbi:MAG: hypothetical protein JOY93_01325 [Acidobacteriales bacterium]|nr:hypothetical protein [Terriglobales bacterium]
MIDTYLVPANTRVTAKGDGPAIDISGAVHRVFLLHLEIQNIIEQESLDISVFGSIGEPAGWETKPLVSFPQKFYRGQHPLLLDLSTRPDIVMIRAHWEVNRWGRGTETPMFEFHVQVKEIPAEVFHEAIAEAKSLA